MIYLYFKRLIYSLTSFGVEERKLSNILSTYPILYFPDLKSSRSNINFNKGIVVFNMHEHLKLAESLTAIDYILEIYLKMKNQEELVKIVVQIGDTYVIPKGVKHAVILANIGKLGLKWS